MNPTYFVFDVESVGLHGEGFSFGFAIVDENGRIIDTGCHACDPSEAKGDDDDRAWIAANVPVPDCGYNCKTPLEVRTAFWNEWLAFREQYSGLLVADCCWPVEARFLIDCVNDDKEMRKWRGPYPLHDLASIILAKGGDPLATNERLPDELPAHDPLCDARQSARLLIEALKR